MKLVLFDLDDTLIQGDSAKLWLKFCVEKGFLPQEYLEKIIFYQKQYQEKKLDMDEFMTFFLQSVKGKNEDRISSLCRRKNKNTPQKNKNTLFGVILFFYKA